MKLLLRLTALVLVALGAFYWTSSATAAANLGDVLIVEVSAQPIGDPAGEYIKLYNNTGGVINLQGWTIEDDSGTITLPSITNIPLEPGNILIVNNDIDSYGCASTPNNFQFDPGWFPDNLGNNGDQIILRDETTNLIDQISYGTNTSIFNPSAPDVFDGTGTTLQRNGYPDMMANNGDATDWASVAGTPCDVSPTAASLVEFVATPSRNMSYVLFGLAAVLALISVAAWRKQA